MAEIVELTRPDNVTLVRGAMQNWRDLEQPGAASPLLLDRVTSALRGVRTVLIAGPHTPAVLDAALASGAHVTVVLRSIPDAASVGVAHPAASVVCGHLVDALAELSTFDLVLALDDVTRTQSLDAEASEWVDLARALASAVAGRGRLLLAVENDLALSRLLGVPAPATLDGDADWTPLATWDASRPRTRVQAASALGALALTGVLDDLYGSFRAPDALVHGHDRAGDALRTLASAWVSRPVLAARSLGLSGRLDEHCSGWLFDSAAAVAAPSVRFVDPAGESPTVWREVGDDLTDGEQSVRPAGQSASLLTALAVACADADLPEVRRLLTSWRSWMDERSAFGLVPDDVRFGNVLLARPWATLRRSTQLRPDAEAAWDAVADFYATLRSEGLRTPWPATMTPRTVLETIGAMAGLTPPPDLDAYLRPVATQDASRADLVAAVARLQQENAAAWARYTWGERRYVLDKALQLGHRASTKAVRDAGKIVSRLRRRGPDAG